MTNNNLKNQSSAAASDSPRREWAVISSDSLSPYENLATEKYIVSHLRPRESVLFLWRNAKTVVIGRNQNCWRECRISELERDGGSLARRLSGGGAVYHDVGNLNFSFIAHLEDYDVSRQLEIIAAACRKFGINASVSGRNDLLADGLKFSGNAFYSLNGEHGTVSCHHGCVLIASDKDAIEKYLSVSKEKLVSKGVTSVRSRVVNLSELASELTAEAFSSALVEALESANGAPLKAYDVSAGGDEIKKDAAFFSSEEWLFGRRIDFTDRFGAKFAWGEIELCFNVSAGRVVDCGVFSDCMDPRLSSAIGDSLRGLPFSAASLRRAVAQALNGLPVDVTLLEQYPANEGLLSRVALDVGELFEENI